MSYEITTKDILAVIGSIKKRVDSLDAIAADPATIKDVNLFVDMQETHVRSIRDQLDNLDAMTGGVKKNVRARRRIEASAIS